MTTKNTFKRFYESLDAAELSDLATRAETSVPYLSQIAHGHRKAGASVCARLKSADNRITDAMLRPDLYGAAA